MRHLVKVTAANRDYSWTFAEVWAIRLPSCRPMPKSAHNIALRVLQDVLARLRPDAVEFEAALINDPTVSAERSVTNRNRTPRLTPALHAPCGTTTKQLFKQS